MASHSLCGSATEVSGQVLHAGVHDTHRHLLACAPDRELQVAVIRYDDHRVYAAIQDIEEQVGRDVHIRPLLLEV